MDESVRFLDDVIDVNRYPLPQIEAVSRGNRKIGLGVMGFADALFMLGVPYDSDEGVSWGERFMQFINDRAHAQSEVLAAERGSFPNWEGSTWDTIHRRPVRNACCTTVAPTGTISIIAGCSAGIEPLYALVFKRDVLKEQAAGTPPMIEINPIFHRALEDAGLLSELHIEHIARQASIAQRNELSREMRRVFVTTYDIAPHWHVRMQAAFQKHCDASISKTINLPAEATVEDVDQAFQMSYDLRCKGVTVYRNGCRPGQPMYAWGICLESTIA